MVGITLDPVVVFDLGSLSPCLRTDSRRRLSDFSLTEYISDFIFCSTP